MATDSSPTRDRADAEIQIPKMIGKWSIGTDPDVHATKIIELFESGATIVNVHSGQANQRRAIEFYGNQVLPQVRKHLQQA